MCVWKREGGVESVRVCVCVHFSVLLFYFASIEQIKQENYTEQIRRITNTKDINLPLYFVHPMDFINRFANEYFLENCMRNQDPFQFKEEYRILDKKKDEFISFGQKLSVSDVAGTMDAAMEEVGNTIYEKKIAQFGYPLNYTFKDAFIKDLKSILQNAEVHIHPQDEEDKSEETSEQESPSKGNSEEKQEEDAQAQPKNKDSPDEEEDFEEVGRAEEAAEHKEDITTKFGDKSHYLSKTEFLLTEQIENEEWFLIYKQKDSWHLVVPDTQPIQYFNQFLFFKVAAPDDSNSKTLYLILVFVPSTDLLQDMNLISNAPFENNEQVFMRAVCYDQKEALITKEDRSMQYLYKYHIEKWMRPRPKKAKYSVNILKILQSMLRGKLTIEFDQEDTDESSIKNIKDWEQ